MTKLIRYARVSTRRQSADRQEADLLAAGIRHDDVYVNRGFSGARASRLQLNLVLAALEPGDILIITTLDRLGRSTQSRRAFADQLRSVSADLRVRDLGGGDVDTETPMGSMLFAIMAALAQMEHEIKRERVTSSIAKRREADHDLGGRPQHDAKRTGAGIRVIDVGSTHRGARSSRPRRGDDPASSPVTPHLRRGHWRRQRFGPGLEESRRIRIAPVLVNAHRGVIAHRVYRLRPGNRT